MPPSLQALQALTKRPLYPIDAADPGLAAGPLNAQNPEGDVQGRLRQQDLLQEMRRNLELQSTPGGHMVAGATHADVEDLGNQLGESPQFGTAADESAANAQKQYEETTAYNLPSELAKRREELASKTQIAAAPNTALSQGNLAVEQAKTKGALELQNQQHEGTQKLLESLGGAGGGGRQGGMVGPGGSIKPTINASGGVSFTTTQMPALVQRSRNQLMDARDKTLQALQEAERLYPGINDESDKADMDTGGSAAGRLGSMLTGIGAHKYGGPADRANAGLERLTYTLGGVTPFSKLAQEASFGNIEQMAGQLPGVRGLATITPLFKEHQSRWGHEAPLATVQRLRHMAQIMDDTLHTIDTGGAEEPPQ